MGSSLSRLGASRPMSTAALPNMFSNQQKLWEPQKGIVFASKLTAGGNPRVSSRLPSAQTKPEAPAAMAEAEAEAEVETLSDPLPLSSELQEAGVLTNGEPGASRKAFDELPESSLMFKMTEETFRTAKNAAPDSPQSFWSYRLYRSEPTPGDVKKPFVHYCKSIETTERVLKTYFLDEKVIGFDIEWNPEAHRFAKTSARQNVSLVQIASESRIALFHIALYPKSDPDKLVAPLLKQIMEDPEVTKVGVAIKADCTRLKKYMGIDSRGLFELSHLHKLIKYSANKDFKSINKNLVSLAHQVREHLHLPLFKGGDIRSSNWSQKIVLDQILYAAADSYAAVHLFNTMEMKRKALNPMPPRPYHIEQNLPIRVAEGVEIDTDAELEEAEGLAQGPKVASKKGPAQTQAIPSSSESCEAEDTSLSATSESDEGPSFGIEVDSSNKVEAAPVKRKYTRKAAEAEMDSEGSEYEDSQPTLTPGERKSTRSTVKSSDFQSEFTEVQEEHVNSAPFGLNVSSALYGSNIRGGSTKG